MGQRWTLLLASTALLVSACSGEAGEGPQDSGRIPSAHDGSSEGEDGALPDASPGLDASVDAGPEDAGTIPPPEPPPELVRYLTGDPADRQVAPAGPSLLLMGGGTDVDAAFRAWIDTVGGGDVVILRTSGADGYNDYLFTELGGVDSVETLLVTTRALADHPYVIRRIDDAEGIFLAGGDQSTYVAAWRQTELARGIERASARGAAVGGTSAGLAVLGQFAFTAEQGTVTSAEVLSDPYHPRVTLSSDFLALPMVSSIVFDSHFRERDRMGRLLGFVARVLVDLGGPRVLGIGIDERTAIVVGPSGVGRVYGSGSVYVLEGTASPSACAPQIPLEFGPVPLSKLASGDELALPSGSNGQSFGALSASAGALQPTDPY